MVQRWRVGASVAWSQILLPVTILSALIAVNLDLLHPIQWITSSLSIIHPSQWTYLLLLAFMMGLLAVWEANDYTVRPQVLSTRLAYIWNVFSPNRLLFTTGHALGTGAATWCFVSLVGGRFKGLATECDVEGSPGVTVACVNEHHLFVMLHGAVIGAVYALHFFVVPQNVLSFPIIQQSKFFQIKTQLYPVVKMCGLQVLSQLRYYYIAYYFVLGPLFSGWISRNLHLNQSSVGVVDRLCSLLDVGMLWCTLVCSVGVVDRLCSLLDVGMLWCTLVMGTAIQFLLTLAQRLYNTYQTEPFHFLIEGMFEEDRGRTLPKALACKHLPIVQYLAYQDLCEAASRDPVRRQEIFALSQPGGHPHNWVAISGACLSLLQDITNRMADFNNCMLTSGPACQLSGDKKMATVMSTPIGKLNHSVLDGSCNTSYASTPITNLSFRGPPMSATRPATDLPSGKDAVPTVPFTTKIYNHLMKRKAVVFFIGELPEAPSKRLYADCQIYIWAVEAISHLACASFEEDKYGVVQKTLPEIVSTLLSLKEAVEKHLKLAPNTNRKTGSRGSPAASDSTQRHALRVIIKTALYRVVNTFSPHLSSIPLTSEHARRLRLFMEYKE